MDADLTWKPITEDPLKEGFVLVTLEEDGDRWVEPGWYKDGRFGDIHRSYFRERILAWMSFPKPYESGD